MSFIPFVICCVQIRLSRLTLITFYGIFFFFFLLRVKQKASTLPLEQVRSSVFQRTLSSHRDHYSASFPSESYIHVSEYQTGL